MIELKLNKESELSFEINIEGSEETPKARLMLEMEDKMELSIAGVIKEGQVSVVVPSLMDLKEKLSGENVKGRLEVIVDNNFFIPWEEYFSLKAPITVQAESAEVKTLKTPEIKISVKSKKFEETKEIVKLSKDFRIPKTNILLEKGDVFEILDESDEGFDRGIVLGEGFTIPGTNTKLSKHNRIKIKN